MSERILHAAFRQSDTFRDINQRHLHGGLLPAVRLSPQEHVDR